MPKVQRYDGFLLEYHQPDANSTEGGYKSRYLAVAVTLDDAIKIAGQFVDHPDRLTLVEKGQSILEVAKKLHLKKGEARAL